MENGRAVDGFHNLLRVAKSDNQLTVVATTAAASASSWGLVIHFLEKFEEETLYLLDSVRSMRD